ncbi:MAG: N-6 DNA methylase [Desulfobacterales bacterium]|nr:N-6 DNA methylase [Desulfobacterales bacterium]
MENTEKNSQIYYSKLIKFGMDDLLFKTKNDIKNRLGVSIATVNNWIKTGAISPPSNQNIFTNFEFQNIIKRITSNDSNRLKARANRSMTDNNDICFLGIEDSFLKNQLLETIDIHKQYGLSIEQSVFELSIQILKSANLINEKWFLNPNSNIEIFLLKWSKEINIQFKNYSNPFKEISFNTKNEDFIGAFYQSIQTISSKSKKGSYYTPGYLLEAIKIPLGKLVLDPCCGSGGILMKVLQKGHNANHIYAQDIDEIAIKICRVNLCLFFNDPNIKPNIKKHDIIFDEKFDSSLYTIKENQKFDFIITNPPWGSKFSSSEKKDIIRKYPHIETTESFSIALYNSINKLSDDGKLIFFLPHSFLNVYSHKNIRNYLISKKPKMNIYLLGNPFAGVMSESIRLELDLKDKNDHLDVYSKDNMLLNRINYSSLKYPDFIISATASDKEANVILKVFNIKHYLLKNNAKFALGIVTGNNKKHILANPTVSSEPIFRGKDIKPFIYGTPECFIEFNPDVYQQVAPIELYRQTKIVYRFISDRLICCLDKNNYLLLNSANLFIPTIDYPLESIVILFNSSLYTFLYRKIYHSKKVLRNHIESLPLPILELSKHSKLKELYEYYITGSNDLSNLNNYVYSIFGLTEMEKKIVAGKF